MPPLHRRNDPAPAHNQRDNVEVDVGDEFMVPALRSLGYLPQEAEELGGGGSVPGSRRGSAAGEAAASGILQHVAAKERKKSAQPPPPSGRMDPAQTMLEDVLTSLREAISIVWQDWVDNIAPGGLQRQFSAHMLELQTLPVTQPLELDGESAVGVRRMLPYAYRRARRLQAELATFAQRDTIMETMLANKDHQLVIALKREEAQVRQLRKKIDELQRTLDDGRVKAEKVAQERQREQVQLYSNERLLEIQREQAKLATQMKRVPAPTDNAEVERRLARATVEEGKQRIVIERLHSKIKELVGLLGMDEKKRQEVLDSAEMTGDEVLAMEKEKYANLREAARACTAEMRSQCKALKLWCDGLRHTVLRHRKEGTNAARAMMVRVEAECKVLALKAACWGVEDLHDPNSEVDNKSAAEWRRLEGAAKEKDQQPPSNLAIELVRTDLALRPLARLCRVAFRLRPCVGPPRTELGMIGVLRCIQADLGETTAVIRTKIEEKMRGAGAKRLDQWDLDSLARLSQPKWDISELRALVLNAAHPAPRIRDTIARTFDDFEYSAIYQGAKPPGDMPVVPGRFSDNLAPLDGGPVAERSSSMSRAPRTPPQNARRASPPAYQHQKQQQQKRPPVRHAASQTAPVEFTQARVVASESPSQPHPARAPAPAPESPESPRGGTQPAPAEPPAVPPLPMPARLRTTPPKEAESHGCTTPTTSPATPGRRTPSPRRQPSEDHGLQLLPLPDMRPRLSKDSVPSPAASPAPSPRHSPSPSPRHGEHAAASPARAAARKRWRTLTNFFRAHGGLREALRRAMRRHEAAAQRSSSVPKEEVSEMLSFTGRLDKVFSAAEAQHAAMSDLDRKRYDDLRAEVGRLMEKWEGYFVRGLEWVDTPRQQAPKRDSIGIERTPAGYKRIKPKQVRKVEEKARSKWEQRRAQIRAARAAVMLSMARLAVDDPPPAAPAPAPATQPSARSQLRDSPAQEIRQSSWVSDCERQASSHGGSGMSPDGSPSASFRNASWFRSTLLSPPIDVVPASPPPPRVPETRSPAVQGPASFASVALAASHAIGRFGSARAGPQGPPPRMQFILSERVRADFARQQELQQEGGQDAEPSPPVQPYSPQREIPELMRGPSAARRAQGGRDRANTTAPAAVGPVRSEAAGQWPQPRPTPGAGCAAGGVRTPELSAPELSAPELSAPELSAPDADFGDGLAELMLPVMPAGGAALADAAAAVPKLPVSVGDHAARGLNRGSADSGSPATAVLSRGWFSPNPSGRTAGRSAQGNGSFRRGRSGSVNAASTQGSDLSNRTIKIFREEQQRRNSLTSAEPPAAAAQPAAGAAHSLQRGRRRSHTAVVASPDGELGAEPPLHRSSMQPVVYSKGVAAVASPPLDREPSTRSIISDSLRSGGGAAAAALDIQPHPSSDGLSLPQVPRSGEKDSSAGRLRSHTTTQLPSL